MVDEERQAADRHHQELHPESVVVAVICGLEFGIYQVNRGIGTGDIDDLHGEQATKTLQEKSRCSMGNLNKCYEFLLFCTTLEWYKTE